MREVSSPLVSLASVKMCAAIENSSLKIMKKKDCKATAPIAFDIPAEQGNNFISNTERPHLGGALSYFTYILHKLFNPSMVFTNHKKYLQKVNTNDY